MYVRGITIPRLDSLNPCVFLEIGGHFEVLVRDFAAFGNFKRHRHLEDHIRLPDLPARFELGRRRQILRIAFLRASVNPSNERPDLIGAQLTIVAEMAVLRIRRPWRHLAIQHAATNRRRVRPDLMIRHQRHRRGFARPVTAHAILVEDGRHIPGKRGRIAEGRPVIRRGALARYTNRARAQPGGSRDGRREGRGDPRHLCLLQTSQPTSPTYERPHRTPQHYPAPRPMPIPQTGNSNAHTIGGLTTR